jgi:hypothetical protein
LYVEERLFGQAKFDFLMKTDGLIRISDGRFIGLMAKTRDFLAMREVAEQFCWFKGVGITKMLEKTDHLNSKKSPKNTIKPLFTRQSAIAIDDFYCWHNGCTVVCLNLF